MTVPAAAQCIMVSGEHGSGRFGGESSGKSDVWKYFYAMFTQGDIKGNTLDDQLTQQPQCYIRQSQYRKSSSTEFANIRGIFGTNIRSQISVFVPALLYTRYAAINRNAHVHPEED